MDLTAEQIGEYLEHQGATDDEINEFLAHFGVSGMRWGTRKTITPSGKVQVKRSTGSKTTIVVGALGASHVVGKIISKYAGESMRTKPGVYIAATAAVTATAVAGARAARTLVDKHGNVSTADLKRLKGRHINDPGLTKNEKTYLGFTIGGAAIVAAMMGVVNRAASK